MTPRPKPQITPRGLNRVQAAEYAGVSPSLFDVLVKAGVMPKPIQWGGRRVFDRVAIDRVFDKAMKMKDEDDWTFEVSV